MNKPVGIVADNILLEHKIPAKTPECPDRLRKIYFDLNNNGFKKKPDMKKYDLRSLTDDELFAVHSKFYIDQIIKHSVSPNPFSYDKDTYLMEDSLYCAKMAAGGCIELAEAIVEGKIERGFALVRPPGHHASIGRGSGFCILNNIALTAQHLINKCGLNRIMIVDFDVHHGDGTQEIFYDNDKVLFISLFQDNIFPFSGKPKEFGLNNGLGFNINIPVFPQYCDLEYKYIFGTVIRNIAEQYLPQIILVSAGFDGHVEDPMSEVCITTKGYIDFCEFLKYFASEFCDGKLLYVLEGGYKIPILEESIFNSLKTLLNPEVILPGFGFSKRANKHITTTLNEVFRYKWSIL